MKYNALIAALFITISAPSLAAINRVVDVKRPPNTVKSVKVFFTGVVTLNKVMSLSSVLDEIGQNYKSATQVLLYISSPGGDIDAGKIGYQIVKNSPHSRYDRERLLRRVLGDDDLLRRTKEAGYG
ncbi:hypothetical protein WDV93_15630 [Pantoea ananatis]